MTPAPTSRALTRDEHDLVLRILSNLPAADAEPLREQLLGLRVVGGPPTALDLEVIDSAPRSGLPDGPIEVDAVVMGHEGEPVGEILVWTISGRLSLLEYAWFTNEEPDHWPSPAQLVLSHNKG